MNGKDGAMAGFPWPPVTYLAAAALAALAHAFYPLPWFGPPFADILFVVGLLLVGAAVALAVSALGRLRAAKTPVAAGSPALHLVTSGAFALTRNPIYLAFTLVLIGAGLVLWAAWFLPLALVAAFAVRKLAIEPEERQLAERFGKKYRDYQKKVRRWV